MAETVTYHHVERGIWRLASRGGKAARPRKFGGCSGESGAYGVRGRKDDFGAWMLWCLLLWSLSGDPSMVAGWPHAGCAGGSLGLPINSPINIDGRTNADPLNGGAAGGASLRGGLSSGRHAKTLARRRSALGQVISLVYISFSLWMTGRYMRDSAVPIRRPRCVRQCHAWP